MKESARCTAVSGNESELQLLHPGLARRLRRAAELRPDLYSRYAALEQRIGHTLSPSRKPLPELTGIPVDPARASLSPTRGIRDRNA
ncbi:MAG: hypothetical protein OXC14_13930, partial [Rhodospirillaceae bacterium]|nr:hypothetical protein [Rhodospirillaceae bacterium]